MFSKRAACCSCKLDLILDQSQNPCEEEETIVLTETVSAASEVFVGVDPVIMENKHDTTRYRLRNIAPKNYANLQRAGVKQIFVCKQDWSPSLDQEEQKLSRIKVEQKELWTSQEGEQLQGLNETDIKVTNIVSIKSEQYKEEPSPESISSDQSETKTEDNDDERKEPGLNTGSQVTVGEDRTLYSSTVAQLITTSGSKPNRARSHCCQECGTSFSRLSYLKTHELVHTGEKPYHCQECGTSFRTLLCLKRHQRVHTGEKPYLCQQCGKSFSRLCHLQTHQLVHTKEKPYHCKQCGTSFSRLSNLQRHQRSHTGVKPYHCQQCGKNFSNVSCLKTHQRIHTGVKPYLCQQCGKSFSQLSYVKSHQRVHTGEKPYHCQQCGKSFSSVSYIKTHQRVHTGVKPYRCQQCGKSFSVSSNLKKHQHVHTAEKP